MDSEPFKRLHPDDRRDIIQGLRHEFASLFEASRQSPAAPPPDKPPVNLDGRDAQVWAAAARTEVDRAIANFLTREQVEFLIERILTERLNRIGLPTDPEHIEETGETVRGAMRWQKRIDKVWGGVILTGLVSAALFVLKLIPGNVSLPGQGGH